MKFRRLHEEEISTKKIRKDLWDKFKKLSEEEIISLAGGEINEIKPFTPMLISKGGKLLSVADSNIPTDVMLNGDRRKAVHADYTNATVYSLLKRDYPELKWDDVFSHLLAEDYGLLGQEHLSDNLGFVRLNTGTTAVEKRFYMVLPVDRPSAGQWDWIEKYLEDGASHNAGEVLVYGNGGDDFHFYSFREYTPEEILGKLKRYYASGKFYEELNEVYPNKGESKEDFISRFMKETAKEYPDKEQRFAVANSYWDRRNKKGVSETFDVDGNLYNPSKYTGIEINDNFKKWFQKGGITDPYHDPLIVYHGSRYDFDSFVPNSYAGEFPNAIYFTDNKKIADTYGNTKEYFIRMQNPYYINARKKSFNDFYDEMLYEFNYAKDNGYDGVVVRDIKDDSIQRGSRSIGTTYAIFDEYNVKSVANSGAWDENTSNVYEDFAGETDSEGNPLSPEQIKFFKNSKNINEDIKSGNIAVYRVGQVNDFSGGLFFTDDLSYFDRSATGYIKKDAVAYNLDLNKAKVIDIVDEWNLSVNSWDSIEQTEEFFNSKGFHYYDYLEDVDYDDKNARHYVITDTDSLAKWAGENGYDVCIIRGVYNNYGQKYNEYVVYRKDLIKPVHNK